MNHPQNSQPQPPREGQRGGRGGRGGRGFRGGRGGRGGRSGRGQGYRAPATPQQAAGTLPSTQEVVPGANVFIVLKEDQPTGRETRGVVSEVLTSGNHPRGIKVRLRGGQVGRVQRTEKTGGDDAGNGEQATQQIGMGSSSTRTEAGSTGRGGGARFSHRYTDVRYDDYLEGPPERSLADFLPADFGVSATKKKSAAPTAKCPMCEDFEGNEAAVTRHIDQVHLG